MPDGDSAASFATLVQEAKGLIRDRRDSSAVMRRIRSVAALESDRRLVAQALFDLGEFAKGIDGADEAAERCYGMARHFAGQVGDQLCKANALKGLADLAFRHVEQAAQCRHNDNKVEERGKQIVTQYMEAFHLYKDVPSPEGQANCLVQITALVGLWWQNGGSASDPQLSYAVDFLECAKDWLEKEGIRSTNLGACLGGLGLIKSMKGAHDEAIEHLETARDVYEKRGRKDGVAGCLQALGEIAYTRGHKREARGHWEEALSLFKELEDSRGVAWCDKNLATLVLERVQP